MAGSSGGIEVIVREQAINVAIAVAVGIGVGLIEDVPIELVPDILILGLALGLIAQEALLVQRTGMIGGTYEKEMKEYTREIGAHRGELSQTIPGFGPRCDPLPEPPKLGES